MQQARNTGLAATAHVRPDCRDSVVIRSTVTLETECTGKDRILITFFDSSSALRSGQLYFYVALYSFHKKARAMTSANVNVARAEKKITLAPSKTSETRSSSLITLKYTWNIKD